MKKELLDQIDSLREYPFFEFNLSKEQDHDLNRIAENCREEYCKQKNLPDWEEYISQKQEDYCDPNPNNFDLELWKKIVNEKFSSE